MAQQGGWFDGQVAIERPVEVALDGVELVLTDGQGGRHRVELADLVKLDAPAGQVRLGHRSSDGWRLVLHQPVDESVAARLPRRLGSPTSGTSKRTIGILAGAIAAITAAAALVIFVPEMIAPYMPMSWERRMGAVYDLPVELARCEDRGGQAALNQILDRLDPKARDDGFTMELIDFDEPNAAALPGGRMVVFNGLFEDMDNADAVAGIVAHEIAHVRRRHVAAGMMRELGLSAIVTLAGGGAVASNASGLLSLKFSRTAESEADADALAMLERAGIDPRPTAAAFQQFRKGEGGWPEWLGSHPASGGRADRFARSYRAGSVYRPVLGADQSKALLAACRD